MNNSMMKKIIFSICAVALILTGCTTFEDEASIATETGPNISVSITNVSDSVFTFTVAPDAEASYYSYYVVAADAAKTLNSTTLYKVGYKGITQKTVKYATSPSTTVKLKDLSPNTTYQVYAIAANTKGFLGAITNAHTTTSDGYIPTIKSLASDNTTMVVTYSENVKLGGLTAMAYYYTINDLEAAPVEFEIPLDNISASGKSVTIELIDTLPGAYVCVTYGQGFVKDSYGNPCKAYSTRGYSDSYEQFIGLTSRIDNVDWDFIVTDTLLSYFTDPSKFSITYTANNAVTTITDEALVKMSYTNGTRVVTNELESGSTYGFTDDYTFLALLPEAIDPGSTVSLTIAKGSFEDAYGNINTAVSVENMYMYSYGFKLEDALGSFNGSYISFYDGEEYELAYTITAAEVNSATAAGSYDIIVSDMNFGGDLIPNEFVGVFNIHSGLFSIDDWQKTGSYYTYNGNDYPIYLANDSDGPFVWLLTEAGHINSTDIWGLYINVLGWYDKVGTSDLTLSTEDGPTPSSASVRMKEIHFDTIKTK